METIEQKIRKNALLNGLLLGIITLVLAITLFYLITGMVTNPYVVTIVGPLFLSILLPLGIAILFCFDLRKKIGGFWNFKQAVTGIFIMFFVSYLTSFAGNMLFSKVIEPDMVEKMKTVFVGTTSTMMKKSGADQEAVDKQVEKVEKSFEEQKNPSIGIMLRGFVIAILIYFVVALIFAAFFKKEALLPADNIDDGLDPA